MIAEHDELTCQELVELVTDYLEGALPAEQRARFDAHLADCDICDTYLDQMRLTIRLTGSLAEERLDAACRAELMARFRHWKRGERTPAT